METKCRDCPFAAVATACHMRRDYCDFLGRTHPAGGDAPAPPSVAHILTTAAAAGGRLVATAARSVFTGESIFVTESESSRRLATCEACPEYDPSPRRCRLCTCYMPLKTRLVSETGRCPLGKW